MGGRYTLSFQGLDELNRGLLMRSNLEAAKTVVKMNGSRLVRNSQGKAPVDTGTLRRSIGLSIEDDGLSAVVKPSVEYAAYVEFGTRFMAAQPFLRPALDQVKRQFNSDLLKLIK